MQTGKQTIYDEDLEENQTWYFHAKGSLKGQGYHGERDNQVYLNGLLQKADPELRYEAVTVGEKRYLINTSGNIQKASSTSTSSAKPELGKGFKTLKIQMILSGQLTVQESSSNILISSVHKYRRPS